MKLLRIRLENLNSLYGESSIDLENDLGGAPIFLIEGKTGSGKSTLMDAVCLALFGETPRLGAKKGDDDHDPRLVMSRGTWRASAQLEFSKVEDGGETRYRATWECHRARKKAEGGLQQPQRSLEKKTGSEWTSLVSSKLRKDFEPYFTTVLEGMTVEDFKRTVLLAQGEFAAFLKVDDTERARILERLTSTSQYKQIGARAKERARQARDALAAAEASKNALRVLSDEEEQNLVVALDSAAAEERRLQSESSRASAALKWLTDLLEASQKLNAGMKELEAAHARMTERSADLERLQEHERCAAAGATLRQLVQIAQALDSDRASLAVLETERASTDAQSVVARESLENARAVLAERRSELKSLEPQILEARQLRAELRTARAEEAKARHALEEARARLVEGDKRLAAARRAESDAASKLAEADALAESLKQFKPLVESMQLLSSKYGALDVAERQLDGVRFEIEQRTTSLGQVRAKIAEIDARLLELRNQAMERKSALDQASKEQSETLGEHADAASMRNALQREERALQALQTALAEARRMLGEERTALQEKKAFDSQSQQHEAECSRLAALIAEEEARIAADGAALETSRQDLEHLRWAQGIARERVRLKADEACPLCGSKDHPAIADGRYAQEDRRIEERCEALEAGIKKAQKELKTREKSLEKQGEARIAEEQQLAFARKQAQERACRAAVARAGIERLQATSATDFGAPDALDCEAEQIAASSRSIEQRRRNLETSELRLSAAQKAVVDIERKQVAAQSEAKDLAAAQASIESALSVLSSRRTEMVSTAESDRHWLREAFESFGIRNESDDLATCLERASALAESWKAADAGATAARERLTSTRSQREKAEALRAESLDAESAAAKDLGDREERVKGLGEAVGRAFDGADPDEVQRRLETAVQTASDEAEASRKVAENLGRKLSELDGRIDVARSRVRNGSTALDSARRSLDAELVALGLADDQQLQVRLLDAESLRRLVEVRQVLKKDIEVWTTRNGERQRAVDELRQVRPEGADEAATLDELRRRAAALEAEREAALQRRIDLQQQLVRQQRDREEAGALRDAHEKARAEAEVWQRLDALIGTNEGGAFQLFAQTLNLQELVARANGHLRRLSNRYSLVGAPGRLAFMIRDEWQAGEERPLTTLSGGETFLVSLALALALADYRTVSMPIETLLLDEGFGTLDRETLETAMQALESLHAAGMQVGVISHVEALKDKIPARIHLEDLGNGRSCVIIPRD